MKRILVIGKDGQIGWELIRALAPLATILPVGRDTLDLTDARAIRTVVRTQKPDFIINAAAYTAVDKAETEPDKALMINAIAPGILAEEAKRLKVWIVHYSTDYVFDGKKDTPYTEDDQPHPLNVYGETKLAGERAVANAGGPHLILRTSWIYGARGHNFLMTMQKLAQKSKTLRIVDDQVGSPTWCRMVAAATGYLVQTIMHANEAALPLSGTYHLTASGTTSWYGFAHTIFNDNHIKNTENTPSLVPIMTSDYPTPAQRPAYSVLSCDKMRKNFGLTMMPWDLALTLCLADIL